MTTRSRVPDLGFYLSVFPTGVLASRLVWEQTALSWEQGPQMVGAALLTSVFGIVLVVAMFGGVLWSAAVLLRSAFTRSTRSVTRIVGATVVLATAALVFVPYGWWVQAFAGRIANGPHASEFLVHMSVLGDRQAVAALIERGVPVHARNRSGLRPIEAAQRANQLAMRDYLASKGGTAERE